MENINYIPRKISSQVLKVAESFPAIVLTGPRQSGKSTLLKNLFKNYKYLTFDDPVTRERAKSDPGLFVETLDFNVIIDEMQYVPEILPYLKIVIDENREKGNLFILTGSQSFSLMEGVTESLAGRVAVLELLPFALEEFNSDNVIKINKLYELIFKGFYPDPAVHNYPIKEYYSSYANTYLERDVRQIINVQNISLFQRFIELLAVRVGSILNVSDLARDCGISTANVKNWLSVLENSRIIYLLKPFYRNIGKRLIKAPKVYFADTGLLSYLLRYQTAETLQMGPMAGNIFENFIIIEFLKYKLNSNLNIGLYFYRDSNKNEIDLLVDEGNVFKAVEIKMCSTINTKDVKFLNTFELGSENIEKYLISNYQEDVKISKHVRNVYWKRFAEIL